MDLVEAVRTPDTASNYTQDGMFIDPTVGTCRSRMGVGVDIEPDDSQEGRFVIRWGRLEWGIVGKDRAAGFANGVRAA